MSWAVYFLDFDGRKRVKFTNWRSFNFTRAYNKAGNINIKLDASPTSKRIRAGWDIVVEKHSNRVYYGKVVERREKDGLITLVGTDIMGMLNKQNLFKRPTLVTEASEEVIRVLNGLKVAQGVELKADNFVEKTSTSKKWHWENNSILRYIKDIGEQVNNLSGFSNNFVFWVDPYYNVWFGQSGNFGSLNNVPIKTISLSEDIDELYNKITVKGNPINAIPYDFDFWTEQLDATTWFSEPAQSVATSASDYVDANAYNNDSNVLNPSYATVNNNQYATLNYEGVIDLTFDDTANLAAGTRTFTSSSLLIDFSHTNPYVSSTPSVKVQVTRTGSFSPCSGHTINSPSGWTTINCTHSQHINNTDFTNGESTGNYNGNLEIRITNTSPLEFQGDTFTNEYAKIQVDHAYHKVNYSYINAAYTTNRADLTQKFANFGLRSVELESAYGGSGNAITTFGKRLYSPDETATFNMENFDEVRFQYYIDTNASTFSGTINTAGIGEIIFGVSDGSTESTWTWTVSNSNEAKDSWAIKTLNKADATFSGSADLTNVIDIRLKFKMAATGASHGFIYLDNYYFVLDQYQHIAQDTTSQNKYGIREKTLVAREFFSNAECEAVAIILLANLKNPVQKFNITAEGFIDVYPNTVFTFKYDDEEYNKPLVNITYYVNEDGSESMQFTVGDYKKDDVDVILDKFVEINRNADLLKNPYKLA